ncbi:hypothetical protein PACILC2_30320 [Paenibacillus cisolokensis]|uniref:Uncharacterized protein n=1 Tax=Paenibacillus cisolokensis TaxID=1658519 RepID=A0ABQ4N888_9BACL|nr:hypothetical protein PACILC2_30320 [Paenibacillus cisolokensis]
MPIILLLNFKKECKQIGMGNKKAPHPSRDECLSDPWFHPYSTVSRVFRAQTVLLASDNGDIRCSLLPAMAGFNRTATKG